MNNKRKLFKLTFASTIISAILVAIDLYSKSYAFRVFYDSPLVLIDNVLELYCIKNTGAAFSFLDSFPGVFLILVPCVFAVVLYYYFKIPISSKYYLLRVPFVMILSGAIGNYIDRLTLGFVRDFIYFSLIDFPVFNVADIYVTLGVVIMVLLFIFKYNDNETISIFFNESQKKDE